MMISLENLSFGMDWWHHESNWGMDLMNSEYEGIFGDRALGITTGWWDKAVDRLGKWRAYRGSKPPNKRAEITGLGSRVLSRVADECALLVDQSKGEPCIEGQPWEKVEALFSMALEVKKSPVFAGKMCHFLFPNLFIVMDNWATSVSDYEIYWRGMRDAWRNFPEKHKAKEMLAKAIGSTRTLHPLYPMETKILELCHIGHQRPHLRQVGLDS